MTERDDLVERHAATERDLRQALAGKSATDLSETSTQVEEYLDHGEMASRSNISSTSWIGWRSGLLMTPLSV